MFLANANWNLTAFLAFLIAGFIALALGYLVGSILWRKRAERVGYLLAENERMAREASALERECRGLETESKR